ncbi:excisionase family DNA binding protein [Amycolatopsis endophytica]|uniref:Excisionase family DNA binding protein n=1 Tax=Amycolatopsis endophytica TaxID=860233 RepID=A0A853AVL9_9PSEU|nr:helix-turn-helix domain-containing protein [Amycolatopsis endophytica]NYI86743.1 excisionase family DNA binding protein [Amycolatopsis endophytica]
MAQELYTVEQVAQRLGLHVRTVRNYVRDGRLNAVRIGKQYRIAREDLDAFTGRPAESPSTERRVEVSSIVQIEGVDQSAADRIASVLRGVADPRPGEPPMRIDTVFDAGRRSMKVVVLADLTSSTQVLRLVSSLAEE